MTTSTMTLADAITYHQLSLQAEGRSPATLRLYLLYERRFLEYLESAGIAPKLDALNLLHVRNAIAWLRTRSIQGARSGQTVTRTFASTLKIWASFLEAEGIYTESPIARLKRPMVPKVLRQPFSETEVMALWAASRETRTALRDEALVLLLFDTGMRIGEATSLTLDKLRLDERHIIVGMHGKGRRERMVPIGNPTKPDGGRSIRALRAYLRDRDRLASRQPERAGDRLFLTLSGYPLTAGGGSDVFRHVGAIAGVPNAIPHRARHSFATHYLTANPGDEFGLRRIIGHASDQVTADYVHLAQTTIAARVSRSSLVESLSAPKQTEQRRSREPIEKARADGPLEPPRAPAPARPREPIAKAWGMSAHARISDLLTGLDANERRALLKALLAGDAA
jgi:site-specific recombinase XerD